MTMTTPMKDRSVDGAARVSDAEREEVVALLTDACGDGVLDVGELDERLHAAFGSRTAAELARCTHDLSPSWQAARRRRLQAAQTLATARAALRLQICAYLAVMALLVGIWLTVALTSGAWYPWPVWPALGWGSGIVVQFFGLRAVPSLKCDR